MKVLEDPMILLSVNEGKSLPGELTAHVLEPLGVNNLARGLGQRESTTIRQGCC